MAGFLHDFILLRDVVTFIIPNLTECDKGLMKRKRGSFFTMADFGRALAFFRVCWYNKENRRKIPKEV
jgi:hypothetical protein